MSIFIQFINDNMVLFVFTIIAAVLLIGAVAALIVMKIMQKRKRVACADAGRVSAEAPALPDAAQTETQSSPSETAAEASEKETPPTENADEPVSLFAESDPPSADELAATDLHRETEQEAPQDPTTDEAPGGRTERAEVRSAPAKSVPDRTSRTQSKSVSSSRGKKEAVNAGASVGTKKQPSSVKKRSASASKASSGAEKKKPTRSAAIDDDLKKIRRYMEENKKELEEIKEGMMEIKSSKK